LALELFPASGQLGENTTTRWYKAPRYKNVVFKFRSAPYYLFGLHRASQTPKRWHLEKFLHLADFRETTFKKDNVYFLLMPYMSMVSLSSNSKFAGCSLYLNGFSEK